MRFAGKVAIVTGGAQGIGAAVVARMVAEGGHVVIFDRNVEQGRATADLFENASFIEADLADSWRVAAAVESVLESFGHIDVLVNNAATANNTPFLDVTEAEFEQVIGVNLTPQFVLGQRIARHMVESGRAGAIVNMSSMTAQLGVSTQAAYASSKGAVESLTRVMAVALAEFGIRVNGVGPGSTATPMVSAFFDQKPDLRRTMLSRIPLRRLGTPDEIASVVAFLASDDASYMTGQILYPDGGRLALNYTVPVAE